MELCHIGIYYTSLLIVLEDDGDNERDRIKRSMEESGEGQKAPSQLVIPKPGKQKTSHELSHECHAHTGP